MNKTHHYLLVLGLATLAIASSPAAQKSAPCATLFLQADPTVVAGGGAETLSGSITNCSQSGERLTISYDITGPCNFDDTYTINVTLKAGETQKASVTRAAPTCPGTYTVTGKVTSGTTFVTSASTSFTVQ